MYIIGFLHVPLETRTSNQLSRGDVGVIKNLIHKHFGVRDI